MCQCSTDKQTSRSLSLGKYNSQWQRAVYKIYILFGWINNRNAGCVEQNLFGKKKCWTAIRTFPKKHMAEAASNAIGNASIWLAYLFCATRSRRIKAAIYSLLWARTNQRISSKISWVNRKNAMWRIEKDI